MLRLFYCITLMNSPKIAVYCKVLLNQKKYFQPLTFSCINIWHTAQRLNYTHQAAQKILRQ